MTTQKIETHERANSNSNSTSQILSSLQIQVHEWTHIELGAANYAANLYADTTHINKGPLSESQYTCLFKTLDNLIDKKGKRGTFYINDLKEEDVNYTINKLSAYIKKVHSDAEIEIKPLVGDFFKIDLPKVHSIHLKNPEYWFYSSLDDLKNMKRLAYFSDCSEEGLTLITQYKRPFIHRLENLGVGYRILNDNYDLYIHSDGSVITKHGNNIEFSIKSLSALQREEQAFQYITKSCYPRLNRSDILYITYDIFGHDCELIKLYKADYVDPKCIPVCPKEEVDTNQNASNDSPLVISNNW